MSKLAYTIILLVITAVSLAADENPSVEQFDHGWINWERQIVKAVGHGVLPGDAENMAQAKLMARAAAISDAYRNLAIMVNGVRVTGDTLVENYITKSDEIRLKVDGFIRGAEIVSENQLPDRSFEVIVQMPFTGKSGIISGLSADLLSTNVSATSGGEITGLIIDAIGLGVQPAMSPKIYDEDGNEVYGTVKVSPDFAIEVGIAVYPRSMEQALKSPRAGKHPLTVKALRKGTKFATDVVISNADAARIREADSKSGFLSRCQVSILLS